VQLQEDTMKRGMFWAGAALAATLMCPDLMYAVTIGQVDNFEDGTTQNWVINLLGMGSPPPSTLPVNVPTGGPAGAGDNYLRLTSTGSDGAGGRLVGIQYQHQWAGNYLAAGITAIRMDVQNFGQTDLYLRLLFADPLNGPPQNEAVSTTPVFLPVGSGWRSVTFPVGTSFLTPDVGSVAAALTNATEFRIYNNAGLGLPSRVAGSLGVDNITATVIPEPATWTLFGAALVLLLGSGMRRK
jgi:hypothetical protein